MTLLIVSGKKKNKGKVEFTIGNKGRMRKENEYKNIINIKDARQLAIVLDDLEIIFGAPVEKDISLKRNKKSPFWWFLIPNPYIFP